MAKVITEHRLTMTQHDDTQELHLPMKAELLCVRNVGNDVRLIALVESTHPLRPRKLRLLRSATATGSPGKLTYLDSYSLRDGQGQLFHVFEER